MKTIIEGLRDNIIGVNYDLVTTNAKELSDTLKTDVNVYDFISEIKSYASDSATPKETPLEIYEYQNFFLLKNGDEFVLLDGFRRLLFFDTPDIDIQVRIYDRENMTDQQILKLLVMLNHTKFFGGIGKYFERGFSLALYRLFGIDVKKIHFPMDGYLKNKVIIRDYNYESTRNNNEKVEVIKQRIVDKMFISDMLFIQKLSDTDFMTNDIFGALLYHFRTSNPDFILDVDKFISIGNSNTSIVELHTKYKNYINDQLGSRTKDVINKLIPLYKNVFYEMIGKEPVKTLAECLDYTKKLVNDLKKNKSLIKMTGNQSIHLIDRKIEEMASKNEPLEFVCVIHPRELKINPYTKEEKIIISDYGLIDVKFLGLTEKRHTRGEILIGTEINGKVRYVNHNYSGSWGGGYSKKYTKIPIDHTYNSNLDLFVKMDKSILKKE